MTLNKLVKRAGAAMMAALLAISTFSLVPNDSQAATTPNVNAKAAFTIEESTGKVLYEKNPDQLLGIASMTKMLDEYILLEKIDQGKLKWTDKVKISDYAHEVSQDTSLSNVPLRNGGFYTVKELYQAMAIYSANGAAIALAEKIAGSEKAFVGLMNEKANSLKLGKHKFVNVTGLNNSDLKGKKQIGGKNSENKMTARGMAKLAKSLIDTYPDVLKTASTTKLAFRKGTSDQINMSNWNWLLPGLIYGRKGVDGLKTGTTDYAGMCLTATAKQDGMRVITVILHANGGNSSDQHDGTRFKETNKMLDYAFDNFKVKQVAKAGQAVKKPASISVKDGKEDSVKLETNKNVNLVVPKDQANPKLSENVKLVSKEITAPVKKEQKLGTMEIALKNDDGLGYIDGSKTNKIQVVATNAVDKSNGFVLMLKGFGSYFVDGVKGWFN